MIGWGIAEALMQAKHLATALAADSDAAVERYWRERDVDAMPRFRLAEERGAAGRLNPVLEVALKRVPEVPGLAEQMFRETEYDVNPYELMPIGKVVLWTLAAAIRGRPGLIGDFLRMGSRARAVQREVATRRRLLDGVGAAGN